MLVDMRVLSFCHYLQGPACTQYLADMGADVIKVEPPGGAFERHWSGGESYVDGVSAFLMCANRNKRSLAIDLKKPAAKDIMDRLVDRADVVVENFRPGVMERLGLGYETLRRRKPEIVYASATGLGAAGPMKDRPGQDLLMQARSGLMAVTANHEIGPTAVGAAVVDQHGGALARHGGARRLRAPPPDRRGDPGRGQPPQRRHRSPDRGAHQVLRAYRGGGRLHARPPRRELVSPRALWRVSGGRRARRDLHERGGQGGGSARQRFALRALNDIDRYAERDRYAQVGRGGGPGPFVFAELAAAFDAHGRCGSSGSRTTMRCGRTRRSSTANVSRDVPVGGDGRTATLVNHPLRYDGELPEYRRMPFTAGEHSRVILAELGYAREEIEGFVAGEVVVAAGRDAGVDSAAAPAPAPGVTGRTG